MALFQKSVLNQYLKQLDKTKVENAYQIFKAHFHNATIQQHIRDSKEEQYQGEFLIDLFVNVLGYIKNPQPNFNLQTEQKNETNSKKADGAILKDSNVIAVIELKGTNTTDLATVAPQAFGYKNNQKECKYVIISNFEKLRFYIDNAIDFEEFNLFTLTENEFNLLYLCLHVNNILSDLPAKIKQASTVKEIDVTKQLYKDYSDFKRKLFTDIVQLNPQYDKLILFKKSQKLLDRLLFIFFAEDRGLLQANTIQSILDDFEKLKKLNAYFPLYDLFKKHFTYLNTGFKNDNYDVFGYNGGLFANDEILDTIKISDNLLLNYTPTLAKYDYETEIDVNILGHIFEHSLNDIEEIQAELDGKEIDKTKTKRKKDGVFYTPKYITKYIIENTVGSMCTEKRNEYGIVADNYTPDKRKAKKKELLQTLDTYQNWLLQITIVDPAYGSGAFLNQALDFLIQEHKGIDELRAQLLGHSFVLPDHEIEILENNIFGVDLNDESVEIARLSLWLRTARKGRKLNSLNNNIKCGNSLICDTSVAGEKAFNWQNEFPTIFERGGFDIVIGNPPYVKEATNKNAFNGLHQNPCYQGKMDLWYFFGWLGLDITKKDKGVIGYIAPNNWITNDGASKFRNKVLSGAKLIEFVDFGDFKVFETAGIQTMIYIMKNSTANENYLFKYSKIKEKNINQLEVQLFLSKLSSIKTDIYTAKIIRKNLENSIFNFPNETKEIILEKISMTGDFHLNNDEISSGIDIGQDFVNKSSKLILGENGAIGDGVFNLSQNEYKKYNFNLEEKRILKPFFTTKEINRYYSSNTNNFWVIYTTSKFKNVVEITPYPTIKTHLDKFKNIITSDNKPYGLHRARNEKIFLGEKILSIRKCAIPSFSFVDFDCYVNRTFLIIQSNRISLKYLIAILNSQLVKFWLKEKGKLQGELFQIDINPLVSIPIKQISLSLQQPFIEKAETMLQKNKELQTIKSNFSKLLQTRYSSININTKIGNWNELTFKDFCKELEKQKIKLSISEQAELMQYFEQERTKANLIQQTITQTDKEIDTMVYKLYELTNEEIAIVESN